DFAQVLFLVGQLAVMSIFLGGGEIYTDEATNLFILLTHTGEWGGMIAYGAKYLRLYPWVVIPSTVFLTAAILILSNFSQHLQKRFARPHLYRSAPLYKNKPRLALVAAAVAVCVAVVTVLPNKSPGAIRTTAAVGGELGHDPSSEAMRYQLEKVSGEFMNLLKRGNWDYAQSYIQGKLGESLTPYKMFEPFNLWLHALNKLDYRYVGIGTITTAKGGRYENPYDVELLIATPDGQKETWHLQMSVGRVARVLAGYGGPKLDLADGDAPVLLNQEQREKITHATAEQFMKLLQANDWEAAAKLYQAEEPLPPGVIPDPFDKWLEALSAHRYEFVATDKPSRYYGSLRTGDTVIVKVKNLKSGSVANWTVNVLVQPDGKTAKITYGRGTPAKS
ncbi:MAG TPA: hypothetical protein VFV52_02435, partial [Bacilli bacterium]|nr:hypothetical protein [Bacilli bacterium]